MRVKSDLDREFRGKKRHAPMPSRAAMQPVSLPTGIRRRAGNDDEPFAGFDRHSDRRGWAISKASAWCSDIRHPVGCLLGALQGKHVSCAQDDESVGNP